MNKALLLMAVIGLAASAQAAVVNVNFSDAFDSTQKLSGTAWSSTVAPLSYTGTTWNDTKYGFSGDWTGPSNNLLNSDGAAAGVGFTLTSFDAVAADWSGTPLLLKGGFWSSRPMTLTIKGLSQGSEYDLYLAGNASNNNNANFTVGSQSLATSGTSNNSFVENDNFVHFSALSPDSSGNIVVTIAAGSKGVPIINGFQLTDAVPEPTALAGLALSGLLMLRRQRA